MRPISVYLSGPMSGTKEESTKWRNEIKEYLKVRTEREVSERVDRMRDIRNQYPSSAFPVNYLSEGIAKFDILDPCTRWFDDKEYLWNNSAWIVKLDKMEIEKASVLIVNASDPAWGTPMEQIKSYDDGKFVIVFCSTGRPSIWAKEHCHVMVYDHIEAAEWLYNHSVEIARTL